MKLRQYPQKVNFDETITVRAMAELIKYMKDQAINFGPSCVGDRGFKLESIVISNPTVPRMIRMQIVNLLKSYHPKPVPVLSFSKLWISKYKNTKVKGYDPMFDHTKYGFLTNFQALKSIPDIVEVIADEGPFIARLSKAGLAKFVGDEGSSLTPLPELKFPNLESLQQMRNQCKFPKWILVASGRGSREGKRCLILQKATGGAHHISLWNNQK